MHFVGLACRAAPSHPPSRLPFVPLLLSASSPSIGVSSSDLPYPRDLFFRDAVVLVDAADAAAAVADAVDTAVADAVDADAAGAVVAGAVVDAVDDAVAVVDAVVAGAAAAAVAVVDAAAAAAVAPQPWF